MNEKKTFTHKSNRTDTNQKKKCSLCEEDWPSLFVCNSQSQATTKCSFNLRYGNMTTTKKKNKENPLMQSKSVGKKSLKLKSRGIALTISFRIIRCGSSASSSTM